MSLQTLPRIAIVTPYLADANNGNWRTAHRWQSLLSTNYRSIVHNDWQSGADGGIDLLIALHARRNAQVIRSFRDQFPEKPLVVVLTGTDLYHDLALDEETRQSLDLADALIVLQEDAIRHVPRTCRAKTHVVYQSAKPLKPANKPKSGLRCVVVGHLRAEKSPETIFRLIDAGSMNPAIRLLHIGAGLDRQLAAKARSLNRAGKNYHWSGAMPHGLTRAAIKRAHLLIHPSAIEGGANVIAEAVSAGTPVLASRISGNVGMLGRDYPGYFPVGNHAALAAMLNRCLKDRGFLARLDAACTSRAARFRPEAERTSLCQILDSLVFT